MKLIKINPDHFIVVNDFYESKSDIKQEDVNSFFYHKEEGVVFVDRIVNVSLICDNIKTEFFYASLRKITHSTKELDGVKTLLLSEVKETIGEVDVEKLAEERYPYEVGYGVSDENTKIGELQDAYVNGYNQCLQDNKDKIYTDSDIRGVILLSRAFSDSLTNQQTFEEVMLHIQPKTEWDVEFVNSKITLI